MDNDTQPAQIAPVQAAHPADAPDPVATEVAARLDGLIAQLRSALEK